MKLRLFILVLPRSALESIINNLATTLHIEAQGFGDHLLSLPQTWSGQGAAQILKYSHFFLGGTLQFSFFFGQTYEFMI